MPNCLTITLLLALSLLPSGSATLTHSVNDVTCADQQSKCPDGSTCCLLNDGRYGCCPLPNAVCCDDHEHCCPEGTTCAPDVGACLGGSSQRYPMHKKLPSSSGQPHIHGEDADFDRVSFPGRDSEDRNDDEVECPDHKSKCPPHTTCCPLDSATNGTTTTYGCCPAEEAVCCEDKVHCCPHGTICDLEELRCIHPSSGASSRWYKKFPATSATRKPSVKTTAAALITCSTGQAASRGGEDEESSVSSVCESGSKCCSASSSKDTYCCPFSDGECCESDGEGFCCPRGFRCSNLQCTLRETSGAFLSLNAFKSQPALLEKTLSIEEKVKEVVCGDGSRCSNYHTCCPVGNAIAGGKHDSYKCCPLSNQATCCASGDSCCPRGYRCVLNGKGCEKVASYGDRLFLN